MGGGCPPEWNRFIDILCLKGREDWESPPSMCCAAHAGLCSLSFVGSRIVVVQSGDTCRHKQLEWGLKALGLGYGSGSSHWRGLLSPGGTVHLLYRWNEYLTHNENVDVTMRSLFSCHRWHIFSIVPVGARMPHQFWRIKHEEINALLDFKARSTVTPDLQRRGRHPWNQPSHETSKWSMSPEERHKRKQRWTLCRLCLLRTSFSPTSSNPCIPGTLMSSQQRALKKPAISPPWPGRGLARPRRTKWKEDVWGLQEEFRHFREGCVCEPHTVARAVGD